jgi:hypothetical protein
MTNPVVTRLVCSGSMPNGLTLATDSGTEVYSKGKANGVVMTVVGSLFSLRSNHCQFLDGSTDN